MSPRSLGWHRAAVGGLCRQARGQLQLPAAHQPSFGQERQGSAWDLPGICLLLWGWAGEAGLAAWDLPALMGMSSPAHYSNGDTTLLTVTHTTWPCSEQAGPSPSHRAKHSRQASRFLPCSSSQLKKLTLLSSVLTFAGCPVGHYSFIHNTQAPCE